MSFKNVNRLAVALLALCAAFASSAVRAADPLRAPATPLIAQDPYFSVWSFSDELSQSFPVHWTGKINALTCFMRVDGQKLRVMGNPVEYFNDAHGMKQTDLTILPTNTIYKFEEYGVELTLTFTNPNLPDDLDVLSRPATYLTWSVRSTDGLNHEVKLYFDATAELCVNVPDQTVVATREETDSLDVIRMGTDSQKILAKSGDDIRIDWGYFYAAAEKGAAKSVIAAANVAREAFLKSGDLPKNDDENFPRKCNDAWPVAAFTFDCGIVKAEPVVKRIIVAYDDLYSLTFLGEKLRPYWRRDGMDAHAMLELANAQYSDVMARCQKFDDELMTRAKNAGGEKYACLCAMIYPQTIAAHKLAVLPNGKLVFVSKENFSNGCAGTVDLVYPTGPLFAVLSNELLKHSMTATMEYAVSGRWPWPFAPHDEGQYPLLDGQRYGGGEKTEENQMPVEETANMLILFDVVARNDGNVDYAKQYESTLAQWAEYLLDKGLDPENQLCTDDFAGHLAHNANLSAKAIVALACYADLCKRAGKEDDAKRFREKAEEFVQQWLKLADDGDHYRLAFDKPGTWSMKYNIVWDRLLGLELFPKDVTKKEIAYYKTVMNDFGLPLDNRADYTKLDWEAWTATLADNREDFDALMAPVYDFVDATSPRVPLTDWYFTSTAKQRGFQARSVVGGVYVKMMEK
ncbi:MAG: DUF5127 domain-containing protein [Thermoguttaceae bacterium]|nr:DUF5127 domain-containing protein [Thermoguttaceae bacterium]